MKGLIRVKGGDFQKTVVFVAVVMPSCEDTGVHVLKVPPESDSGNTDSDEVGQPLMFEKWNIIVEDDRPSMNHQEAEGKNDGQCQPAPRFWRRPWVLPSVAIFGGGALIPALVYLFRSRGRSGGDAVRSSTYAPTRSYTYAPTRSYTFARGPAAYMDALSHHCFEDESHRMMSCRSRPSARAGDDAAGTSAYELAKMKMPSKLCTEIHQEDEMKASMINATVNGWEELDWSGCDHTGGTLLCTDGNGENPQCHYFGYPWKLSLPSVWQAIIDYTDPSRCSCQCNGSFDASLHGLRHGQVLAEWAGIDIDRESRHLLTLLPAKISGLYADEGCSHSTSPCQIRRPTCDCFEAGFRGEAVSPSGKHIIWGKVAGYLTSGEEMVREYKHSLERQNYTLESCEFECWKYGNLNDLKQRVRDAWNARAGPESG